MRAGGKVVPGETYAQRGNNAYRLCGQHSSRALLHMCRHQVCRLVTFPAWLSLSSLLCPCEEVQINPMHFCLLCDCCTAEGLSGDHLCNFLSSALRAVLLDSVTETWSLAECCVSWLLAKGPDVP